MQRCGDRRDAARFEREEQLITYARANKRSTMRSVKHFSLRTYLYVSRYPPRRNARRGDRVFNRGGMNRTGKHSSGKQEGKHRDDNSALGKLGGSRLADSSNAERKIFSDNGQKIVDALSRLLLKIPLPYTTTARKLFKRHFPQRATAASASRQRHFSRHCPPVSTSLSLSGRCSVPERSRSSSCSGVLKIIGARAPLDSSSRISFAVSSHRDAIPRGDRRGRPRASEDVDD